MRRAQCAAPRWSLRSSSLMPPGRLQVSPRALRRRGPRVVLRRRRPGRHPAGRPLRRPPLVPRRHPLSRSLGAVARPQGEHEGRRIWCGVDNYVQPSLLRYAPPLSTNPSHFSPRVVSRRRGRETSGSPPPPPNSPPTRPAAPPIVNPTPHHRPSSGRENQRDASATA